MIMITTQQYKHSIVKPNGRTNTRNRYINSYELKDV